jgi:ABC-type uncharacterized transport system involved in gliding motility auxiliary subunit
MNKKNSIAPYLFSTVGVVIMFFIVVAIYTISGAVKFRKDLTSEKLYTLSKGTLAILNKLDTPVEINFYCSQSSSTMPVFFKTYAQHVEELLMEYKKASHGNVEIHKFDPLPDSDAEDKATFEGIEGQMLQNGEKIFLGISVSCLDTKVAIPFLPPDRERLLEYDISRAVSRVMNPKKPVIGIMSSLPIFGEMNPMMMQQGRQKQNPWVVVGELKRDFDVKQVDMTADKIDDDVQVLMVMHPRDITEKTQYAIDQFVLRGGNLLAFLDPASIVDNRGGNNPMQRAQSGSSSMDALLKAWGYTFDTTKVLADMNFVTRINRGQQAEDAPAVISMTQQGIDTNDVATSQIDSLVLPFAGVFTGSPADGLKQTVLIKSSKNSQLVDKMLAELSGAQISKEFNPSGKEYTLALRLTGKFKTAFPEGKPKDKADDKKDAKKDETAAADTGLKESKKDGVVILVGDVDMLYDQFACRVQEFFGQRIMQPINGNITMVQNFVEQLSGDNNLISVRGRATMARPFTVVKEIEEQAQQTYRKKIQELEQSLAKAQQRVNELQQQKTDSGQKFILSADQQKELQEFREKERANKLELKAVRKNLRRDIDSLENRLKWLNIAGMPLLVVISGISLAWMKRKKTAAK